MDQQHRAPVVVGVDGSETALQAVGWATREAHRRGAPLRIVHAAPYAEGSTSGERHAGSILTLAHTVATQALPDLPAVTERLPGPMPQALVDAARGAQLLVVGMSGGDRYDDVLLRSAALDVCTAATCPVAVVRGRGGVPAHGPVVLGVEDVTADANAVTVAFEDAERHASRLAVVHAVHAGGPTSGFHRRHHTGDTLRTDIINRLGWWVSRHPDVPVELQVVSGGAAGHLLEFSVTARLLVLGTHAREAAARAHGRRAETPAIPDSTGRTILRGSACPVVVVPRDALLAESTTSAPSAAPAGPGSGPERWTLYVQNRGRRW